MSQNQDHDESCERVPRIATLDGFGEFVDKEQGIFIKDIPLNTILEIRTLNSVYTLMVLDAVKREVLMKGGEFLPELAKCTFSGSTFGGKNIRTGWIGIRMCMEFRINSGKTITTSWVQSIGIVSAESSTVQ